MKRWNVHDKNKLWSKKVKTEHKTGYYEKPRCQNASQICYERHGYEMKNEAVTEKYKITDNDIVEKNAFYYEARLLTDLFNQLEKRELIERIKVIEIIKILIHLKVRNPSIRKVYSQVDYSPSNTFIKETKYQKEWMISEGINPKHFDTILSDNILFFQNKHNLIDNYKFSLLNWECPEEILSEFMYSNFTILQTNQKHSFITSDDPVFFFQNSFEVSNVNFRFSNMGIALSPNSFLIIRKAARTDADNLFITHKDASPTEVNKINELVFLSSKERVISNMKERLEIFA